MTGPKFVGSTKKLQRQPTGCVSLDLALRGGLILGSIYELYGFTHVGKSSLAYFLAAAVRPDGKILLADFEHFDPDYVLSCVSAANFEGEVVEADIADGETALEHIRAALKDPEYQAAILDSVGALIPRAELEGKITDANMGLRARRMSTALRHALYGLRRNPAILILINHLHPIVALGQGFTTSGGVAIHNNAHVRIRLKTNKADERYYIVGGKVDKLRYGGKGGEFQIVLLPGVGIHKGLTAVVDAIALGAATKDRVVKIGDKSYGYFSKLVDAAYAGETEVFDEFERELRSALEQSG